MSLVCTASTINKIRTETKFDLWNEDDVREHCFEVINAFVELVDELREDNTQSETELGDFESEYEFLERENARLKTGLEKLANEIATLKSEVVDNDKN